MSIQATVNCDGGMCTNEFELDAMDSSDVELKHHELENHGWFIDHQNGYDYCPKCAPIVRKEMEQDND